MPGTTRTLSITAFSAIALGTLAPAARAQVPNGRAFSDLARFSDVSCVRDGQVIAQDLIVNPGGGNVAWLPDGTHLVGTSFAMYDEHGRLLLDKTYGGPTRQSASDVTCMSVGTDPDSGDIVTVVFTAATSTI